MVRTSQYVEVRFDGQAPAAEDLASLTAVSRVTSEEAGYRLYTETPGEAAAQAVGFANERGLAIVHLCTRKPSLEDIFLHLTAERAEETDA